MIEVHEGINVVRDDLYPGGTKGRLFGHLYTRHKEIVYACAATSNTQVSLALAAKAAGARATLFIAKRTQRTAPTQRAMVLGADVHEIGPGGYLSVVQARGRAWALDHGAYFGELGFDTPANIEWLGAEARRVADDRWDEVWCAAGSGVLTRALQVAWPYARHHAVVVGRACNVGHATAWSYPLPLEKLSPDSAPFPSERHYDAKAWEVCKTRTTRDLGRVLFWNVYGS